MTVPTPPSFPATSDAPSGSSWPAPRPPDWTPPVDASARMEPFSIASLVCGLAAFWIPAIGSILAIVFGHVARHRIRRSNERGAGMALAGLIIGPDDEALAASGWQLEFSGGIGGQACLTLPSSTVVRASDVREGPCRDSGSGASAT